MSAPRNTSTGGSWWALQRGRFTLDDLNDAVEGAVEMRFFHADWIPFRPAGVR
jgi:hypothetical protein